MSKSSHQSASSLGTSVLNYGNNQPSDLNLWNGLFQVLLIFRIKEFLSTDTTNIACFLNRVTSYIKSHPINKGTPREDFIDIVKNIWILSI